MKTLLIDNYDSFTYNLADYLTTVGGVAPTVIRNDEASWHTSRLEEFDNVVISPGPGTPGVAADFGICRDVIAHATIPLLGVCLGHQGIAAVHGGSVTLAAEPRHGRVSSVRHSGDGLFAGLPSPFEVVRYHSWAVDRLPPELEATAWTDDGVLMALRHRRRPQWGVQFHPESIATHHGKALLTNFAELTEAWSAQHRRVARRRTAPAGPASSRAPLPPRTYRLHVRATCASIDAEAAFRTLFLDHEHAFWLDSSRTDDRRGRYSVMGAADGPLDHVVTADVRTGTVTIGAGDAVRTERRPFLDWLDEQLRSTRVEGAEELPFDFHGGWVGYLGYELKGELGSPSRHPSAHPDASMLFVTRFVVYDHATGRTYVAALHTGDAAEASAWVDRTLALVDAVAAQGREASPGRDQPAPRPPAPPLRARHDREAYLSLIESSQRAIVHGESYEICLTNMIEAEHELDVWSAYTSLRAANPAPFAALLRLGDVSVLSTSPERFLRVDTGGAVEARPIKGTRARGRTSEEDAVLRHELAHSEKDRSENLMIVDLMRNDLTRVARPGSVSVPELFSVETYATVHQLVSVVSARLREECTAVDCVKATFPGGSMTGAPKRRTMELIDQLENGPRGVYAGAIGYFSLSGSADLSIAIRTLVADAQHVRYGVGGAIVALSDPEEEFEETVVKAAPLLRLFGALFPVRDEEAVGV